MEIISTVVGKLAEYSVAPVLRQFGYLVHYQSNIAHLDNQIEMLNAQRNGVKLQTDAATRNLETLLPAVELWFARVDQTIEEKEKCFEKEKIAKATCCSAGWFPNLKIRHSLSRKAKKMTPDVNSLLDKKFEAVACAVSPPELRVQPTHHSGDSNTLAANLHEGSSSSMTSKILNFESRKSTLEDVMEALKGNQANLIVICGMGGVGKTTMVGEIVTRAKNVGLFNEYTKAVVNDKPDKSKIQTDIAEFLGLNLEGLQGLEARADQLNKRLSGTMSVLVVLDNVWETLDLHGIGIPSDVKSCKILVTSRNQDIFNEMEENRKMLSISVLPKNDAWSLFKKMAGDYIEYDPELRSTAEQVLKACDGLPVAISTLGSALRGKKKAIWKDVFGLLQEPFRGNIRGMKKNVYQPIRLSYDFLESEEAKSLFLLCCIFGESTDIPVEDLVTHGFGLRVFHRIDSIEGGRDRVESLVDMLKSWYLLVDSDKEECVRMHDVVRAVGLAIASDESTDGTFLVRHGVALENWPRQHICTSLTTNKTRHELLLVSSTEKDSEVVRLDAVNGLEYVKVLDISNHCVTSISRHFRTSLEPLPLLLSNVQTLCLRGSLELQSETVSVIGELRTLTILRLGGSSINHVPEEFKNLYNLKLLDLADCLLLETISQGVISSLSKLEEFYLWRSFQKWSHVQIAGLWSELLQLPLLTSVQSALPPTVEAVAESMHLLPKLKRFRFSIQRNNKRFSGNDFRSELVLAPTINPGDNMLILDDLGADCFLLEVSALLKRSHCLSFARDSLVHPFNVIDAECGANLKELNVIQCHALEYLVDLTRTETPPVVFPVLAILVIDGARKLKEIFHGVLPVGSLKSLRRFSVECADELMHVWKTGGDQFDRLERLMLWDCESLQVIVAGHHEEEASDDQLNFPNLTFLYLENLPRLVGITSRRVCKLNFSKLLELQLKRLPKFTGQWLNCLAPSSNSGDVGLQHLFDSKVDFPVLKSLIIKDMHNFEEIWHNQLAPYTFGQSMDFKGFQHLSKLSVSECECLRKVCSSSIARSLVNLNDLSIMQCYKMEEIVAAEEGEEAEDTNMFPRLRKLTLDDVPNLVNFCRHKYALDWLSVEKISIKKCPGMKKFCSGSLTTSAELEIDISDDVDENVHREIDMSKRKA